MVLLHVPTSIRWAQNDNSGLSQFPVITHMVPPTAPHVDTHCPFNAFIAAFMSWIGFTGSR